LRIGAQLLVWPSRPDTALRGDATQACLALADLVEVTFAQDQQPLPVRYIGEPGQTRDHDAAGCRHIAVPRAIASTGAYANGQSAKKRCGASGMISGRTSRCRDSIPKPLTGRHRPLLRQQLLHWIGPRGDR
jgi:hypothetical protein